MLMSIPPATLTLTGHLVRLEPLRLDHAAELFAASRDPALWQYKVVRQPASLAAMEALIAATLKLRDAGGCVPFAIISLEHGSAVGETRYHSFNEHDRNLEIGWTWLTPAMQRTGVNTECKYVLLCHAFDTMGAIRVQFRTHYLNTNSQRAIERLGAVREGMLRNQMIMPDGSYRHTVYFSIIESEWPAVKERLERLMRR